MSDSVGSSGSSGSGATVTSPSRTRSPVLSALIIGGVVLLVFSIVREITNQNGLTSAFTFGKCLRLAVPIGLAALGGLYAERAGVVNIGLEGMMTLGTWFGAWGALEFGPWWGVVLAVLGGAAGGLIHAIATVTFGVNHIVSGVAINLMAGGLTRYLSVLVWNQPTQSPGIDDGVPRLTVPGLARLFGNIERRHWFFASDFAGLLHGLTANVSVLTVIAVALFPLSVWVLWRTVFGLRLRSVGEAPTAAETLGVNVIMTKYVAMFISGGLAGLAGAFLVLEQGRLFRESQTGGRGFIGLAALIFGNWRPISVAAGALLFGLAQGLALGSDAEARALLLVIAFGFAIGAVAVGASRVLGMRGANAGATGDGSGIDMRAAGSAAGPGAGPAAGPAAGSGGGANAGPVTSAAAGPGAGAGAGAGVGVDRGPATTPLWRRFALPGLLAVLAIGAFAWHAGTDKVPNAFVDMTPYLVTLAVLAFAAQHLRPPAAAGQPYRKGEAH